MFTFLIIGVIQTNKHTDLSTDFVLKGICLRKAFVLKPVKYLKVTATFKARKPKKPKSGTKQRLISRYRKNFSDNRDKQYTLGKLISTYQNDNSITRNDGISRAIETSNKRNRSLANWEIIRSDKRFIIKKREDNVPCDFHRDNCHDIKKTTPRYKSTDKILTTNAFTTKNAKASTQALLATHISTDILQLPSSTSTTMELQSMVATWTSTSVPLTTSTEDVAVPLTMRTVSFAGQALETKPVNDEGKTEPTTELTKRSSTANAMLDNTFSQISTERTPTTETEPTSSTSSGTTGKDTLGIYASSTTTKLLTPLSKLNPSFNSRSRIPEVTTTSVQTDTVVSQIEATSQADNEIDETASILSTARQNAPSMRDSGALAIKTFGSVGGFLVALSTVLCLF